MGTSWPIHFLPTGKPLSGVCLINLTLVLLRISGGLTIGPMGHVFGAPDQGAPGQNILFRQRDLATSHTAPTGHVDRDLENNYQKEKYWVEEVVCMLLLHVLFWQI